MLRLSCIVIIAASLILANADVAKDSGFVFPDSYDRELNDEPSLKDKIKTKLEPIKNFFSWSSSDGCPALDAPLNGQLVCQSSSNCQATCYEGFRFPKGEYELTLECQKSSWNIQGANNYPNLPHCEPICLPECKNNGICSGPNQCNCPENFSGPQCQFENKPCLNHPPLTVNAQRKCNSKTCTITCMNHFTFPDGSSVANLICKHGNWEPTRSDWVAVPDCIPTCNPPCQNGGVCLSLNVCQCPKDYRGAQCQYHEEACSSKKLGFNGGLTCSSTNGDTYSCQLNCPAGVDFEFAPAPNYVCSYATGQYLPQPVPRCQLGPGMQLISIEGYNSSSFFESNGESYQHFVQDASGNQQKFNRTSSSSSSFDFENIFGGTFGGQPQAGSVYVIKRPESAACFTWSGVHFKTFDGQVFSFEGNCEYTLLKETRDNLVMVTAQNEPTCQQSNRSTPCSRIVRIYIQNKVYVLAQSKTGQPEFRAGSKILSVPTQLEHLRVEGASGGQMIVSLDEIGLKIHWDGEALVQLEASESLWNRTAGLCGNHNGLRADDFSSKTAQHIAAAWRAKSIGEQCTEHSSKERGCAVGSRLELEANEFCSQLFADARYKGCSESLDLLDLQAACRWDYCSSYGVSASHEVSGSYGVGITENQQQRRRRACEAMSVYVQQCAHKGLVTISGWRNNSLCPMECPKDRVYSACGPRYQPTCGEEPSQGRLIRETECEEGCFCPEGTLLHEGRCVRPNECPCRLRGRSFPPGATVPKDCNTCACEAGRWTCTESNCGARCSAVGDPHYTTFDGKHYDFMGQCAYYLVYTHEYTVEAENAACSNAISEMMGLVRPYQESDPSCTKTVTIRLNGVSIKLKQNRQILVNGEELRVLPNYAGGAKLRIVSSIFISVQLPDGLEVLWDGVSRVYVNAPAHLRGKTKGLCGTFTANQKDDFLTPDGDVEQSVAAFANKWKADEQCADVKKDWDHPCKLNPQKSAAAEKYCSVLKNKIFSGCHWHVDPEPFYRDCVYDMCACESNVETCLCPVLAAYAKECAELGAVVPWRHEVPQCQIHCPGDQEYQVCGSSCSRSCADISFNVGACKEECVEGCNCPKGFTLDVNGDCIPIGQCPCVYGGLEFLAGYREVRPASKGLELCSCAGGLWNCRVATTEEIRDYPAASELKNQCSAAKHFELTTCEPAQPRTCRTMHRPIEHSPAICKPGCVCKSGYVLDTFSNACVREQDCPCYHGGQSYAEGEVMQEECNTCTCRAGKWNCTDIVCPGVCSVWGDSHYKTFDDREFDVQGVCDYVLAKGKLSEDESFEVTIRNVACGTTGVTCSKSISLTVGKNSHAQQESVTLTRGKSLTTDSFNGLERIAVRRAGLFVFLDVPELGLVLQWDEGTRAYLRLDARWKSRIRGLCGDFDDDAANDFKTPSGGLAESSAVLFADAWKLSELCAEPAEKLTDTCARHPERQLWATQHCRVMKSSLFEPCHSEIPPDGYIERCVYDACGCDDGGDCECLCTAIAAYAHECNARGVHIKWRSQKLCPMQCDETCSSYSSCVSTCPPETCDNLLSRSSALCEQDTCVEGCRPRGCPEGHVYLNASHAECVLRSECRPVCLILNGVTYYEGDKVSGDDCHSCFCSRGKQHCTGAPCPPVIPPQLLDQNKQCKSGWTKWFNRDTIKQPGFRSDIEELPTSIEMLTVEGSPVCGKEKMVDIQCRTADTQISYKDVGMNIDCSLQQGLVCLPSKETNQNCPDFEIRVQCQCEELPPIDLCHINAPSIPDQNNCYNFYECQPGVQGNPWVQKTCGPDMMYNPDLHICDWPANVIAIRPNCGNIPPASKCPPGEHWSECAVQCSRTCHHFKRLLTDKQICNIGVDCVPGCVPDNVPAEGCRGSYYWRDERTCVQQSDCLCSNEAGFPIIPGALFRESECKSCQCINNFYSCDDSSCPSTEDYYWITRNVTNIHVEGLKYMVKPTVSPPPKCSESNYVWLSERWPLEVNFSASSYESNLFTPDTIRLQQVISLLTWHPDPNDKNVTLEIHLQQSRPIYGITVGGDAFDGKHVTSYYVLYSDDGQQFYHVGQGSQPELLRGPIDPAEPVQQMFNPPFEAKVVRVIPHTWYKGIAMQIELIGCDSAPPTAPPPTTSIVPPIIIDEIVKPECDDQMGYEDHVMSDQQISVSSSLLFNIVPDLRLSSVQIWQPLLDNLDQYVQFDFLDLRKLTGVETKGGSGFWTTAYNVFYSADGKNWNPVMNDKTGIIREFLGNVDDYTSRVNYFYKPINARFLRIYPTKWHRHIGLKVEIRGCFQPYPTLPPPVPIIPQPTPEPQTACNICRGISWDNTESCKCDVNLWWDGRFCVTKQECPCVVGHIAYPIGASYETENCDQCLCTLGGGSACRPKTCEPCARENERPELTPLCGCICKPCPAGTKLCPTSGACVEESRWCDGVQDCSDDELNCHYVTIHNNTKITVQENTTIQVTCQTSCPPGFVMESADNSGIAASYANFSFTKTKTKSSKFENKLTQKYKLPGTVNFNSRMGESDEYEEQCPKFICKLEVQTGNLVECPKIECPEGFIPKVDPSKSHRKSMACDNTCVPLPPKERTCSIIGRFIATFDELKYKYDICNHILARDRNENRWYIVAEKSCDMKTSSSCAMSIIVTFDEHVVQLHTDMHATIDGLSYSPTEVKRLGDKHPAMQLSRVGNTLRLESRRHPFWVMLEADGSVKLGVSEKLAGHVDGMCGLFDGRPDNDRTTPKGVPASTLKEFGDSWRVTETAECRFQSCPAEVQEEALHICNLVHEPAFEQCHEDRGAFVTSCLDRSCACLANATAQHCRCRILSEFATSCLAARKHADLSTWRATYDCPAVCQAPFVHKDCYRNKCEMSCENLRQADSCPVLENSCVSGCFCPDGLVRSGDTCVPPSQCRDCVCNVLGNSNYVTFDRKSLFFDGNCTYVLARDVAPSNKKRDFQILLEKNHCVNGMCAETITVQYGSHVVIISTSQYNELEGYIDNDQMPKLPYNNTWLNLEETPNRDVKLLIPAIQLEVVVFLPRSNASIMIRLPSHSYAGSLEGLCGNCNGRQDDDLKLMNGMFTNDISEFGKSWIPPEILMNLDSVETCSSNPAPKCVEEVSADGLCEKLLYDDAFVRCHSLVDPIPYFAACKDSLCSSSGDVCANFLAYARMCGLEGLCLDWRTPSLCPYSCPSHLEYRACGLGCRENCEYLMSGQQCAAGPVEGCFCPGNQVWRNDSCVSREACFVCDNEGHYVGDVWHRDKCTECTCKADLGVDCVRQNCPARETVCDENSTPVLVTGTENECCPRYLCVPITPSPCIETQQPSCGYGQVLKISTDANGCQKFICQCVPAEECPQFDIDIRSQVNELEPGFVQVTDTSGCCPKNVTVCKTELCPKAPICQKYHVPIVTKNPNACCEKTVCEPPKDKCLYYLDSNNFNFEQNLLAKDIGESWSDGKCKTCSCELRDGKPVAKCSSKDCLKLLDHPDINEYVLEELSLSGQCCPGFHRTACKHAERVFQVGETWQPEPSNACVTTICLPDPVTGAIKQTSVQNCTTSCELGFEYRPPADNSVYCCGICVPIGCVVAGELKAIGEYWWSPDHCVNSQCVLIDGSLQVQQTKEFCKAIDPTEELNYKIELRQIPGKCCPVAVRTACFNDGKYYLPGESWKSAHDSCVVESCVQTVDGTILKQKETLTCNTNCVKGSEYQLPAPGHCCGECKPTYCIFEDSLYKPGMIWTSDDNCTSYSCVEKYGQLSLSVSSETCPALDCAPEDVYSDGCCKRCKIRDRNLKHDCSPVIINEVQTVGMIVEKDVNHGLCKNVVHIEGLTECNGHCNSSTHFDFLLGTYNQIVDCKCCQPLSYKEIIVELICEDGQPLFKALKVPMTCSCNTCSSEKQSEPEIFQNLTS